MEERRLKPLIVALCLFSTATMGCNLYGKLDNPDSNQARYAAAIAAANDGRCQEAIDLLKEMTRTSDDVFSALGWAHLCVAGATAGNIATSIYKFSTSEGNYTVVGALAGTLIPMDGEKHRNIQEARVAFSHISQVDRQKLSHAIADLVLASSYLASQAGSSGGGSALETTDVSPNTSCVNFRDNCAGAGGTCTAGMSDANVTNFLDAMNSAATNLAITDAADLKNLATAIRAGLGAGSDQGRCFIFNRMIP